MPILDISIESATARLTDIILGEDAQDLAETLKAIASDIGLTHVAYLRLSPDKSPDICLLVAVVTYSRLWQHRYFAKKYMANDPVISYGREADQPFDWATVPVHDPATKAFFAEPRTIASGETVAQSARRLRARFVHERPYDRRMGSLQSRQHEEA